MDIWSCEKKCRGLKTEFELAMVSESSMFVIEVPLYHAIYSWNTATLYCRLQVLNPSNEQNWLWNHI